MHIGQRHDYRKDQYLESETKWFKVLILDKLFIKSLAFGWMTTCQSWLLGEGHGPSWQLLVADKMREVEHMHRSGKELSK
jgi:hypothetical protein